MGTIADKLTYLNTTKQNLKDSINNLGGNITSETTFRNYANVLNNIFDSLPKITGKDSILNLSPTLKGRLISTIYGNTLQNGTPTPSSPIPIQNVTGLQNITICGKNLFDKDNITTGYYISSDGSLVAQASSWYSNYISVKPSTTYTIQVPSTTIRVAEYNNSKTFIQRLLDTTNLTYTFTTDSNTNYLRISGENAQLNSEQLEKGSTATTYEAYQSQSYDINLGKNLCYECSLQGTANLKFYFNKINQNNITLSFTTNETLSGNTLSLFVDNVNKGAVSYLSGSVNTKITQTITFTSSQLESIQNGTQMWLFLYKSGANFTVPNDAQIEKGSQATTYSPYFTPIELNKIEDYKDYISGTPNNWVINRQIKKIIFDGTQGFGDNGSAGDIHEFSYSGSTDKMYGETNILSNYFGTSASNAERIRGRSNNSNLYFRINRTTADTTTEFKTWLSTHNTTVIYVLATPTTEQITNTELINQLNALYNATSYDGTTNIIVSGDLAGILDASMLLGDTSTRLGGI